MVKQAEDALQTTAAPHCQPEKSIIPKIWPISVLLCALAYVLCILATTVPLYSAAVLLPMETGISKAIISVGHYLHISPDPHTTQNSYTSQQTTSLIEFLLLMLCMFIVYILCAICIQRQKAYIFRARNYIILLIIGITTMLAAYIYVFTPATLSEDIYLYADYGRILLTHHANPYFTPPLSFPQDPLFHFVWWKNIVAIYGPIWMLVCAALTSFTGTNAAHIFLAFRIFASTIHIINTILIFAILRTKGCSICTVLLGTQLYAWNPLVLFESSSGGHNDLLMVTFALAGILYAVRTEKSGELRIAYYIPSLLAFTLAVLVKFTIIPILALFIIMLSFKTYSSSATLTITVWRRLRLALLTGFLASTICLSIACLFYGPFWLGHNIKDILHIFSSQPPANFAFTSLLSALQVWNNIHPLPAVLAHLLSLRIWNILIYGGMILVLLLSGICLLHAPTIRNMVLMTLAVMTAFLLTTNWFLPWYVTWTVSLAVVCLPTAEYHIGRAKRVEQALFALTLTFSFSAFLTYYYNFIGSFYMRTRPTHIGWLMLAYFATFTLPVLAFLVFLVRRPLQNLQNVLAEAYSICFSRVVE